jgi:hypothetical protein
MARRYAEKTAVPIGRSRGEIDHLLRQWGCLGIQWTDAFDQGRVALRFVWERGDTKYMARFTLNLPTDEDLKKEAVDQRSASRQISEGKLRKLQDGRGRSEHRVLLLWLKAAFNAVEVGIVSAEEIFLPFLEDANGKTFAEIAIPRLPDLLQGSATKLLGTGR